MKWLTALLLLLALPASAQMWPSPGPGHASYGGAVSLAIVQHNDLGEFDTSAPVSIDVALTGVKAGSLLVAAMQDADGTGRTVSITSSPTLTWNAGVASNDAHNVAIKTALFSAGDSVTVTGTFTSSAARRGLLTVWEVEGQEATPAGASGYGFGTPPSEPLTTTRAGSLIFCGMSNPGGDGGETMTYLATPAVTEYGSYYNDTNAVLKSFAGQATTVQEYTLGVSAPSVEFGLACLEVRSPP